MTTSTALPRTAVPRRAAHGAGFWVVAATFATELAFCAVPTPLYAIYQQRDGFPTIVLTAIFAAYAVGVMLSLYLAGHLSDHLGRRRVILASLLLDLVAAVLFLVWNDVAGLVVARFVSGLGIGVLTATATAHLAELGHVAGHTPGRIGMVATFANLGGIGLGPLIGALIATWSSHPPVLPYEVFAVLLVVEGALVALVPETVDVRRPRPAYRPQRVAAPEAGRGAFWAAGAAAFGAFAVFGTFMGLSSTILVGVLGTRSHLLAGVAPFIVFASAASAQVATARLGRRPQIVLAVALAGLGLAGIGLAAVVGSLVLFLVCGGVAGAGIGILFRAAVSTAAAVAHPDRRSETLAAVFLIAYAGMTVPPLLAAAALIVWPTAGVVIGFCALAAALAIASGTRLLRRGGAAGPAADRPASTGPAARRISSET